MSLEWIKDGQIKKVDEFLKKQKEGAWHYVPEYKGTALSYAVDQGQWAIYDKLINMPDAKITLHLLISLAMSADPKAEDYIIALSESKKSCVDLTPKLTRIYLQGLLATIKKAKEYGKQLPLPTRAECTHNGLMINVDFFQLLRDDKTLFECLVDTPVKKQGYLIQSDSKNEYIEHVLQKKAQHCRDALMQCLSKDFIDNQYCFPKKKKDETRGKEVRCLLSAHAFLTHTLNGPTTGPHYIWDVIIETLSLFYNTKLSWSTRCTQMQSIIQNKSKKTESSDIQTIELETRLTLFKHIMEAIILEKNAFGICVELYQENLMRVLSDKNVILLSPLSKAEKDYGLIHLIYILYRAEHFLRQSVGKSSQETENNKLIFSNAIHLSSNFIPEDMRKAIIAFNLKSSNEKNSKFIEAFKKRPSNVRWDFDPEKDNTWLGYAIKNSQWKDVDTLLQMPDFTFTLHAFLSLRKVCSASISDGYAALAFQRQVVEYEKKLEPFSVEETRFLLNQLFKDRSTTTSWITDATEMIKSMIIKKGPHLLLIMLCLPEIDIYNVFKPQETFFEMMYVMHKKQPGIISRISKSETEETYWIRLIYAEIFVYEKKFRANLYSSLGSELERFQKAFFFYYRGLCDVNYNKRLQHTVINPALSYLLKLSLLPIMISQFVPDKYRHNFNDMPYDYSYSDGYLIRRIIGLFEFLAKDEWNGGWLPLPKKYDDFLLYCLNQSENLFSNSIRSSDIFPYIMIRWHFVLSALKSNETEKEEMKDFAGLYIQCDYSVDKETLGEKFYYQSLIIRAKYLNTLLRMEDKSLTEKGNIEKKLRRTIEILFAEANTLEIDEFPGLVVMYVRHFSSYQGAIFSLLKMMKKNGLVDRIKYFSDFVLDVESSTAIWKTSKDESSCLYDFYQFYLCKKRKMAPINPEKLLRRLVSREKDIPDLQAVVNKILKSHCPASIRVALEDKTVMTTGERRTLFQSGEVMKNLEQFKKLLSQELLSINKQLAPYGLSINRVSEANADKLLSFLQSRLDKCLEFLLESDQFESGKTVILNIAGNDKRYFIYKVDSDALRQLRYEFGSSPLNMECFNGYQTRLLVKLDGVLSKSSIEAHFQQKKEQLLLAEKTVDSFLLEYTKAVNFVEKVNAKLSAFEGLSEKFNLMRKALAEDATAILTYIEDCKNTILKKKKKIESLKFPKHITVACVDECHRVINSINGLNEINLPTQLKTFSRKKRDFLSLMNTLAVNTERQHDATHVKEVVKNLMEQLNRLLPQQAFETNRVIFDARNAMIKVSISLPNKVYSYKEQAISRGVLAQALCKAIQTVFEYQAYGKWDDEQHCLVMHCPNRDDYAVVSLVSMLDDLVKKKQTSGNTQISSVGEKKKMRRGKREDAPEEGIELKYKLQSQVLLQKKQEGGSSTKHNALLCSKHWREVDHQLLYLQSLFIEKKSAGREHPFTKEPMIFNFSFYMSFIRLLVSIYEGLKLKFPRAIEQYRGVQAFLEVLKNLRHYDIVHHIHECRVDDLVKFYRGFIAIVTPRLLKSLAASDAIITNKTLDDQGFQQAADSLNQLRSLLVVREPVSQQEELQRIFTLLPKLQQKLSKGNSTSIIRGNSAYEVDPKAVKPAFMKYVFYRYAIQFALYRLGESQMSEYQDCRVLVRNPIAHEVSENTEGEPLVIDLAKTFSLFHKYVRLAPKERQKLQAVPLVPQNEKLSNEAALNP